MPQALMPMTHPLLDYEMALSPSQALMQSVPRTSLGWMVRCEGSVLKVRQGSMQRQWQILSSTGPCNDAQAYSGGISSQGCQATCTRPSHPPTCAWQGNIACSIRVDRLLSFRRAPCKHWDSAQTLSRSKPPAALSCQSGSCCKHELIVLMLQA